MITATFGDVASRWVGETTEKVMAVFNDAERQAPCALFMDEIDSLLIRRDKTTQADSEGPKTVNAVLNRLVQLRLKGIATRMIDIEEMERKGGTVPKGILFYGPPGTGKTSAVKSLAKTTGWALLTMSVQGINRG